MIDREMVLSSPSQHSRISLSGILLFLLLAHCTGFFARTTTTTTTTTATRKNCCSNQVVLSEYATTTSRKLAFFQLAAAAESKESSITDQDDDDDDDNDEIPRLPPFGFTSWSKMKVDCKEANVEGEEGVSFVNTKFQLQYTCKICDARNTNMVSRKAYREGVVVSVCQGCTSKHLIADNLGWHNYIGGFEENCNIEEFMKSKGEGHNINRVSSDVFQLEKAMESTDGVLSKAEHSSGPLVDGHFE